MIMKLRGGQTSFKQSFPIVCNLLAAITNKDLILNVYRMK